MHFYSIDEFAHTPAHGYFKYETTSRYAFATEQPGAAPFYGWYAPRFNDFVLRTESVWVEGHRLGYENQGLAFWAYAEKRANAVKLRHLASLTHLENFQTPWDQEADTLLQTNQWSEIESHCFVATSS